MTTLGDSVASQRQRVALDVQHTLAASGGESLLPAEALHGLFDSVLNRVRIAQAPTAAGLLRQLEKIYGRAVLLQALLGVAAGIRRALLAEASSKRVASIGCGAVDRVVGETLAELGDWLEQRTPSLTHAATATERRDPSIIRNIREILSDPQGEAQTGTILALGWIANDQRSVDAKVWHVAAARLREADGVCVHDFGPVLVAYFPMRVDNAEAQDVVNLALHMSRMEALSPCAFAMAHGELWLQPQAGSAQTQLSGAPVRHAIALALGAAPGEIVVDATIESLLGDAFVFAPLTSSTDGHRRFAAFKLDREQPQQGERWEQAALIDDSEFVEHGDTVASLSAVLQQPSPGPHVITLGGRAGSGRRRLLNEALSYLALPNGRALWGRPHPLTSAPYWPLVTILRQLLDLGEGPAIAQVLEKRVRGLNHKRLDNTELMRVAHTLSVLLGAEAGDGAALEEVDQQNARSLIAKAASFLIETAAERLPQVPLVIIIDDAQALDSPTRDVLQHVISNYRANVPLIVVLCHRGPGIKNLHPAAQTHALSVQPMEPEALITLATIALNQSHLPEELEALLLQKAAGSPMTAVTLLRYLVEAGALRADDGVWHYRPKQGATVPHRLPLLIKRRIENLPQNLSKLLKDAATLGHQVPLEMLATCVRQRGSSGDELCKNLNLLAELGFLARGQQAGVYCFEHAIIQHVAYHLQSDEERQEAHQLMCRAYITHFANCARSMPALIFHHAMEAEDWPLAKEAAWHAVRRAALLHDYPYVLDVVERALPHTQTSNRADQPLRYELLAARERVYDARGQRKEQMQDVKKLISTAEAAADPLLLGKAHHRAARLHLLRGDSARALRLALSALEHLQHRSPLDESNALRTLALVHWHRRNPREAALALSRALKLYEQMGHRRGMGFVLHSLGMFALDTGAVEQARSYFEQALQVKKQSDDRAGEAVVLDALGQVALLGGEAKKAVRHLHRSAALKMQLGLALTSTQVALGEALLMQHDALEAENLARQAIKTAGAGPARIAIEARILLAQSLLFQGKKQAASRAAAGVLKAAQSSDARILQVRAMITQVQVDLLYRAQKRLHRAVSQAGMAAELSQKLGAFRWRLEALSWQASGLHLQNDSSAATIAKQVLQLLAERNPIGVPAHIIRARCEAVLHDGTGG